MAEKRGLNYIVETRANLAGLDSFLSKITQVEKAWKSLKESTGTIKVGATQNNIDKIGKSVPQLKAAAKYLKSISFSIASINRQASGISRVFAQVNKNTKSAARSARTLSRDMGKAKTATNGVARAASSLASKLSRAAIISGRIVAIYAGFQAIKLVLGGFQQAVVSAFKFSDSIQKAELGIRSLLFSMLDVRDAQGDILEGSEAFAATTAEAKEQVRLLRIEGLRTSATFQELVETFQTALGPGLAAGLSLAEIRRVTVLVSQAATAIGLPQEQLSEEIRSLITGTGTERTTRLAKQVLKINPEDIKSARETGELFEFIEGKLLGFGLASEESLNLLSTNLINLADVAKQTLAQGLAGSFEKVRDVAKELNAFFGQGENASIIQLNPEVVELFQRIDDIMQSMIDSAVTFGKSFNLDSLGDTIEGFAVIGGFIAQVGLAFVDIVVVLAKVLGLFGNIQGAMDSFLPITFLWRKLWQVILTVATALLIKMAAIRIAALATQVQIFTMSVLVPAITAAWEIFLVQLGATQIAVGLVNAKLVQIGVTAKALAITFAQWAIPVLTVIAILATVVTFFDKDFRPALVSGFKSMWAGIVLGAEVAFLELTSKLLRLSLKVKDFFGLDLLSAKAQRDIDAQAKLVQQLEAGVGAVAQFGETSGFDTTFFTQQNLDDATDKLKQLREAAEGIGIEQALSEALAEEAVKTAALVDAAAAGRERNGLEGLALIKETVAAKVRELLGFGEDEEEIDLTSFTNKFNEAEEAFSALSKAAEKADDKLSLARAQFGLSGSAKSAAALTAAMEISTRKAVELGQNLRQDVLGALADLEAKDPDLITDKDIAAANTLAQQLLKLNRQLEAIEGVSASALGTQFAADAQLVNNKRILRIRLAQEEILELEAIAKIRSDLLAGQISEEEAASAIRIEKDANSLLSATRLLEVERNTLLAQSAQATLDGDRAILQDAAVAVEDELFLLAKKTALVEAEHTEELRRQAQLREDPQAEGEERFLRSLESKQEIIAQGTENLLKGFNDGLVNVLGDSLTDALFSQENSIRDKWESLMKDLVSITIKTFLESKISGIFKAGLDVAGAAGSASGGGGNLDIGGDVAVATGGKINAGTGVARGAHFGSKAQHFNRGGQPAGVPSSDTVPAWLTPGEWVTKLASARMYGDQVMSMINSGSINPIALKTLAASSGRTKTRRKAMSTSGARGYASGGSVANSTGGGGTTIINSLDEDSLAILLAGKSGERVIHNHLLNLGVVR